MASQAPVQLTPDLSYMLRPEDLQFTTKIADGFYGEVYRGRLWGKNVAIKRLKRDITSDVVDDLKKEVRVLRFALAPRKGRILCGRRVADHLVSPSLLRHPNVILFMGFCEQLPTPSIVFEYAPKGNLYNALRNEPITDDLLWRMVMEICEGMNYLHHRECLHLDLKPVNLLVSGVMCL